MQENAVESEFYFNRAGWRFWDERRFSKYGVSFNVQKRLAGGLVHQDAGDRVFSSGLEVFISDCIDKDDLLMGDDLLTLVFKLGRCTDFRDADSNGLAFCLKVFVLCNLCICFDTVQLVKYD